MPLLRIEVATDRATARRVMEMHRKDQIHHESRAAATAETWRLGWTPAGDPVFVGTTNGEPIRLLYDVEVYSETTR